MRKIEILLFSIIFKVYHNTLTFIMKKNNNQSIPNNENTDFSPYLFPYSFIDGFSNVSFIFDTTSFFSWEDGNNVNDTCEGKKIFKDIKNNKLMGCPKYSDISIINSTKDESLIYYKMENNIFSENKGAICLNTQKNKESDFKQYNFLETLILNKNEKYINFIQDNLESATLSIGEINRTFMQERNRKCVCNITENNIEHQYKYWCCSIIGLRAKNVNIFSNIGKKNLYAIFTISEEFIIAPKDSGSVIMNYYLEQIKRLSGDICQISENNDIQELICNKFTYLELPDLTLVLEKEIGIMAIGSDLFKNINKTHVLFKIKVNKENNYFWYLGEPIIKNYNLLLNFTSFPSTIIIIPSNLNGFVLIVTACVSGFFFLFIFLTMLYCISHKDKTEDKPDKLSQIIMDNSYNEKKKQKEKSSLFGFLSRKKKNKNNVFDMIQNFGLNSLKEPILHEENELVIQSEKNNLVDNNDNEKYNDSINERSLLSNSIFENNDGSYNNDDSFSQEILNNDNLRINDSYNSLKNIFDINN